MNKKKNLAKEIYYRKSEIHNKREKLKDSLEKLIAIKSLIKRNKDREKLNIKKEDFISHEITEKIHEDKEGNNGSNSDGVRNEVVEKIHFPMLILGTKNRNENQINVCFSKDKNVLMMSFKDKFSLMGDMDVLLKLGFQKNAEQLQYSQNEQQIRNLLFYFLC